jgi:ABC-type nitrate/sulfonate/bicarbonate transport system substrate-binding protein
MQKSVFARNLSGLVAIGACAALLAACGDSSGSASGGSSAQSQGSGVTTLRVVYQPTATALPALVAVDEGIFAKHHLQVTLTPASGLISQQINALGHQFDVAMGTQPDLIRAAGNNLPVVEISGGAVDSPDKPAVLVIAKAGSGISSLKDLEGKRVGSPSLSGNIHLATLNALDKAGVDSGKVKFVEGGVPVLPDQLKAGQVDAIECLQPYANKLVSGGGISLGDPFASIAQDATINLWLANKQWADGHRAQVQDWQAAMTDAAQFIQSNDAEARQVLQKYLKLPPEVVKTFPLQGFDSSLKPEELSTWLQVMKKVGGFQGSVQADKLVPNWAS